MVDENRFRRRIHEIRDRMNAQFNRLLNEDLPEEEQTALLDRYVTLGLFSLDAYLDFFKYAKIF